MTYKTYLFDMDGTLLDTLDDLTAAVNHTLEQYGYPRRTREEVRRGLGNGAVKLTAIRGSPASVSYTHLTLPTN